MKKSNTGDNLQKLFIGLAGFLFVFEVFLFGLNVGDGDWQRAIPDAVLAAFWGLFLFVTIHGRHIDALIDNDMKHLERFGELLEKLAKADEERRSKPADGSDEQLEGALMAAIETVTKGEARAPKKAELPKIEKLFNEATGATVELTLVPGGLQVHIHKATKVVEKPIGRKIPVRDLDAEEEKRKKRNAARRAKRAEAKANEPKKG